MDIQTSNLSDGILVTIGESRIDVACAVQFKDGVREISCGVDGRIVLDLQRVDFVDSSGLGAIVAAMKLMTPNQTMELAALSPTVDKVFRLTRMDTVFTIHQTLADVTRNPDQTG